MVLFLQTVLVIIILAAMVMVLLGVGHLSTGHFHHDDQDLRDFREKVENDDDVITSESSFHSLVGDSSRCKTNPKLAPQLAETPRNKEKR